MMGRLRVALQAGQLDQPVPGGIGRYVEGLLRYLPDAGVTVERFGAGRWRYEAWHRFRRPAVRVPGDLVHAPSLAVPPPGRRPLVVTVHDLAFRTHPECFPPRGRAFHERGLELARDEAAAVVVPSEATAGELRAAGFEAGRIHVAYHGIDLEALRPLQPPTTQFPLLGSLNPYQQAHPHWPQSDDPGADRRRTVRTRLRCWGSGPGRTSCSWGRSSPARASTSCWPPTPPCAARAIPTSGWSSPGRRAGATTPPLDGEGVVAPGRIDEATLDALYRGAAALAVPSLSEGFGLPALEAMARGCPVVASKAGALPEVVGRRRCPRPARRRRLAGGALDGILSDEARRRLPGGRRPPPGRHLHLVRLHRRPPGRLRAAVGADSRSGDPS